MWKFWYRMYGRIPICSEVTPFQPLSMWRPQIGVDVNLWPRHSLWAYFRSNGHISIFNYSVRNHATSVFPLLRYLKAPSDLIFVFEFHIVRVIRRRWGHSWECEKLARYASLTGLLTSQRWEYVTDFSPSHECAVLPNYFNRSKTCLRHFYWESCKALLLTCTSD